MSKPIRHQILIGGGGTGGITVAAQLTKGWFNRRDVAVVEPSDKHYDQPLWTLVGGGVRRCVPVRPIQSALEHVAAETVCAPGAVLERDAHRQGLSHGRATERPNCAEVARTCSLNRSTTRLWKRYGFHTRTMLLVGVGRDTDR